MNYAPTYGWYYNSLNDRAPAWTSVSALYNFLTGNKSVGPYGTASEKSEMEIGDILQMEIEEPYFHHTAIIEKITNSEIYVATHTFDSTNRPLSSYLYKKIRFIHIIGVRKWE